MARPSVRVGAVPILLLLLAAPFLASATTMRSREDLINNTPPTTSNGDFISNHQANSAGTAKSTPSTEDYSDYSAAPTPVKKITTPKPTPATGSDVSPSDPLPAAFDPNDPLSGGSSSSSPFAGTSTQSTSGTSQPAQVTDPSTTTQPAPTTTGVTTCKWSRLSGYTSAVKLTNFGYILHWKVVSPTVVNFAIEAKPSSGARLGWVSVGFSKDGAMNPADAIIANTPSTTVGAYSITGKDAGSIKPSNFWIGDASLTLSTNSSLVVKFQRNTNDGLVPITSSGPVTVIWAYSADNKQAFTYHDNKRGSIVVDLSCLPGGASTPGAGGIAPTVPAGPVTPVSVGKSCAASSLPGYNYVADLYDGNVLLHWKVTSGPVFGFAIEAKKGSGAETGWISVGWSTNGAMAPADAVVGNLPGVQAYKLAGYKMADLTPGGFGLGPSFGVSYSSTGSTLVTFSRNNADGGSVPINLSGETYVIWAFTRNSLSTFGYHSVNRGLATIDFLCNSAPNVVMKPGNSVPNVPGEDPTNVDETPAEIEADEARAERRRQRRASRGAAFRSWMDAAVGVPSVPSSGTPSGSDGSDYSSAP
eukprot:TRINITY_DN1793_c0_g1_i2.p1 TRINITY_DN1793_c0_g1~~TRINITY_DN1793_c0_g1_i2.p1  ORF type:complete len:587 (-),score=-0.67 TRINITY_DN1793_c0_g1_i2:239-1999(-)